MKKFSKTGVTVNDLPNTRRKQFFFILKHNFTTILRLGFWFTICSLPLVACYILKNIYAGQLVTNLTESGASNTTIQFNVLLVDLTFGATNFITLIPLSIGFSMIYRVYRNLLFDNGVLFKEDVLKGIKVNFKNNYLCSLFINVFLLIFFFIKFACKISLNSSISGLVCGILFGIFDLLVVICLISFELNNFYLIRVPAVFKTSGKFFISGLWMSLLYIAIFIGFRFLITNVNLYVMIALAIIALFLAIPILILIHLLYSFSLFDLYLNDKYPEYKNKGLYKK